MDMKTVMCILLSATILVSCADCECRIDNGVPNFRVTTKYVIQQDPHNIFLSDTIMSYEFVRVTGKDGRQQEYVGQTDYVNLNENNERRREWKEMNLGGPVSGETHNALLDCLKKDQWMKTKQGLQSTQL